MSHLPHPICLRDGGASTPVPVVTHVDEGPSRGGDQAAARRTRSDRRLKCVETPIGLGHNRGTNHFPLDPESVSD
jgi:hypothetical protein